MTSANYGLSAGDFNSSGFARASAGFKLAQDAVGISALGFASSTLYALNAGIISAAGDLTSPVTSLTGHPSDPTNSQTAVFTFTSNEQGSTFQCNLDNGGYSLCTTPQSYSNLAFGSHTFQVRAIDLSGNADPNPPSHTWSIQYALAASAGTGGEISPTSAWATPGGSVAFTITSQSGYTLASLNDNGTNVTSQAVWNAGQQNYTYAAGNVNANHTIEAPFTPLGGGTTPVPALGPWGVLIAAAGLGALVRRRR